MNKTEQKRRVELYETIASNPSWCRNSLVAFRNGNEKGVFYCDVGWALKQTGNFESDDELYYFPSWHIKEIAEMLGVRPSVVNVIESINDASRNFEANLEAIRTYLVDNDRKKALEIAKASWEE